MNEYLMCSCGICVKEASKKMNFVFITDEMGRIHMNGAHITCCEFHATQELLDHVLNEGTYSRELLNKSFEIRGLPLPNWDKSYVEWLPIC